MNVQGFKRILVVASILIIPSVFYLVIRTGKNNFKHLEIFGPKEISATSTNGIPDTIYHTIGNFSLTDQYGRTVSKDLVANKIYVADFFFATCKTICPKMSDQLERVQDKFKNDSDFVILSHTVNPEGDSVTVLFDYAQKHHAIKDKWFFLTGDKKQIYDLARTSYFATAMKGDGGPDDFIHSEQFALIDKDGRIRGFYDGTDRAEVSRLMDEVLVLMNEYKEKK
ncbi:MAG: SCO family protein [Bacteroidia bacterium]